MKRAILVMLLADVLLGGCKPAPKRVVFGLAVSSLNHPAAHLAVEQINAEGGIKGVPVELMGLDWGSAGRYVPEDIVKWSNAFSDNPDLLGVIGHSDSASTLSAAAIYNQRSVPQIVTIATNPAITNIGVWTYRLGPSDADQGPALAEYAFEDWGKKSAVIFYVNDSYGKGLEQAFEKRFVDLGGRIAFCTMHHNVLDAGDKEMIRAALTRARNEAPPPDLVVLFQRIDAANWTIPAVKASGLTVSILGGDSLAMPVYLRDHPDLTEGMRISQLFVPSPDSARAQKFVADFRKFAGYDPDYGSAFTYDAIYLLRDAVLRGGFSRPDVKRYLDRLIRDQTPVEGVAGTFTFAPDHDALRQFHVGEVNQGLLRLLKSFRAN